VKFLFLIIALHSIAPLSRWQGITACKSVTHLQTVVAQYFSGFIIKFRHLRSITYSEVMVTFLTFMQRGTKNSSP